MEKHKKTLHLMAYIYLQHEKFAEALVLYRLLNSIFPHDPLIALSLSFCFMQEAEDQEALNILNSVPEEDFNSAQRSVAYLLQGKLLWKLGQFQRSRAALKKYLLNRTTSPNNSQMSQ